MTIRRWFFKNEGGGKESVYLYDTAQNDLSTSTLIKLPKSRTKEDLGHVLKIETTEGKGDKVMDKYGVVHGLMVSELQFHSDSFIYSSIGTFSHSYCDNFRFSVLMEK